MSSPHLSPYEDPEAHERISSLIRYVRCVESHGRRARFLRAHLVAMKLSRRVGLFFDAALYHTARGFDEDRRRGTVA